MPGLAPCFSWNAWQSLHNAIQGNSGFIWQPEASTAVKSRIKSNIVIKNR
jgi:hypothetical protein